MTITHSNGVWKLDESFDSFGQRCDPLDWVGAPPSGDLTQMNDRTRRGFTLHEHLDTGQR